MLSIGLMCAGSLVTLLRCEMEHLPAPCSAHLLSYLLSFSLGVSPLLDFNLPSFPLRMRKSLYWQVWGTICAA